MLGSPENARTDNGAPFNGEKFKEHLELFGIKHQRVTPEWPQANGAAEKFIQNLVKQISIAVSTRTSVKNGVNRFLRAYNSTPHTSTGVSPASLMFHRNHANTSRLPTLPGTSDCQLLNLAQIHDAKAKLISKQNFDHRNRVKEPNLQVGDRVLIDSRYKAKIFNKSQPRFDSVPFTVTHQKGTMITAQRPGKTTTRNAAHFQKI